MELETLDLHGYFVADAMARFGRAYHRLLGEMERRPGETRALDVIHGKGKAGLEGVIRSELRAFLKAQGKRISGYDAQLAVRGAEYLLDGSGKLAYMHGEDVDRNPGHTIVVPRERIRLPSGTRF